MNYFPPPQTLDEALECIRGCDDFIVVDKGLYTVINYVLPSNEAFPAITDLRSAQRREMRGIIFDNTTRKLIRLSIPKFFNLGEREETLPQNIDLSQPHFIFDKIDGSLIAPFKTYDGVIRWGSKLGETEFSQTLVEPFIADHPVYVEFAEACFLRNFTPLFELTHPEARIVIDYGIAPRLTLLAVRPNATGAFLNHDGLSSILRDYPGIPLVSDITHDKDITIQGFAKLVSKMEGIEGFVVRQGTKMFKIKTDTYVHLHKIKECVANERAVVGLIIDEKVDDLIGFLPQVDVKRIQSFSDKFHSHLTLLIDDLDELSLDLVKYETSRKDFALTIAHNHAGVVSQLIFQQWENLSKVTRFDWRNLLIERIKKGMTNPQAYRKMKESLGMAFEYYYSQPWESVV